MNNSFLFFLTFILFSLNSYSQDTILVSPFITINGEKIFTSNIPQLDIIDFMPLSSVNYSGGIIITDWYSTNNSDDSIKVSIRFLTNEVRSDALDIKVFNKKCVAQSNCVTSEKEGGINNELKTKILKTAAIYKAEKKKKNSKPYKVN